MMDNRDQAYQTYRIEQTKEPTKEPTKESMKEPTKEQGTNKDGVFDWSQPPLYENVYKTLKQRAQIIAEIRILELEILIMETRIKKEKPRDTVTRMLGINDELIIMRKKLVELKNMLENVEAEIRFQEYHKDMFRALSYTQR